MKKHFFPLFFLFIGWIAIPGYSLTELRGDIYDGNGGPLTQGTYLLTGNIVIPEGETLTIQSGAIIKSWRYNISVYGTLNSTGNADSKVLFTSGNDNSSDAGERVPDSNGAPEPGDWRNLYFQENSQGAIAYTEFRYGGYTSAASGGDVVTVDRPAEPIVLSNCVFQDSAQTAVFLKGNAIVRHCEIYDSYWDYWDAYGIRIDGNEPFSVTISDTLINNSEGAAIQIDDPTYIVSSTIERITADGNGLDAIYLNGGDIKNAGSISITTLPIVFNNVIQVGDDDPNTSPILVTIEPGVIFKAAGGNIGGRFDVVDQLQIRGTSEKKVIFTSWNDDSVDNQDVENDGNENMPERGDWAGFRYLEGSTGGIDHAVIHYAGSWNSEQSAVLLYSPISMTNTTIKTTNYHALVMHAGATLDQVLIEDSDYDGSYGAGGIRMLGDTPFAATVKNTIIRNCKDSALFCDPNPLLHSTFENLTFENNGDNAITVQGTFTASGHIDVYALPVFMDGDWWIGDDDDTTDAITVTVDPGVVIKSSGGRVYIRDQFNVLGTVSSPVIFTSVSDDTIDGYDIRGDGLEDTLPEAGDWDGLHYQEGSGGALQYAELYYAGNWTLGSSGLLIQSPITLSDCLLMTTHYSGVKVNVPMTIDNLTVTDSGYSGGYEGSGLLIDAPNGEVIVKNSVFQSNKSSGIHADSSVRIENVVCVENGADGMSFTGVGTSELTNCRITNNLADGIWIDGDHSVTGTQLLLANNADDGVEARSFTSVHITQSDILNNEDMGVEMRQAQVADFTHNYWGDETGPFDENEQVDRQNDNLNLVNETSLGNRVTDFVDWNNFVGASWFQPVVGEGLIALQENVEIKLTRTFSGSIAVFGNNMIACKNNDSLVVTRESDADSLLWLTSEPVVLAQTQPGYVIQGIVSAGESAIQVLVENKAENTFSIFTLYGPFSVYVSNWLHY